MFQDEAFEMATILCEAYPSSRSMRVVEAALKFQPQPPESRQTEVGVNFKEWLKEGVSANIGDLMFLSFWLSIK